MILDFLRENFLLVNALYNRLNTEGNIWTSGARIEKAMSTTPGLPGKDPQKGSQSKGAQLHPGNPTTSQLCLVLERNSHLVTCTTMALHPLVDSSSLCKFPSPHPLTPAHTARCQSWYQPLVKELVNLSLCMHRSLPALTHRA